MWPQPCSTHRAGPAWAGHPGFSEHRLHPAHGQLEIIAEAYHSLGLAMRGGVGVGGEGPLDLGPQSQRASS